MGALVAVTVIISIVTMKEGALLVIRIEQSVASDFANIKKCLLFLQSL